jgi:methylenetetrahydrofolate--tRNA-(uracil-5-)-methyltransferase
MRPKKMTPAHHSDKFGELVCSNSLKSKSIENASGLLKEEMKALDSLIIKAANECLVQAGQALSVDREQFSSYITNEIKNNPLITVINEEITTIPNGITIIATGPLTSDSLSDELAKLLNENHLYFYDASSPIIETSSINFDIAFKQSRYDNGDADYINCPFNKEEFFNFYNELINAKRVPLHEFEKELHFDACMPIESIAKGGYKSLTFGPMKPVGLTTPSGVKPYAVVQLRQDNAIGDLYNIVGFQTNLTWGEQDRVFKMIPGLENAKIYRYGVMHRNTYIDAPKHLNKYMQLKEHNEIFLAGQLSGVEGYIESSASAILAAINATRYYNNQQLIELPTSTVLGSLINYICNASSKDFKPMNSNYGII